MPAPDVAVELAGIVKRFPQSASMLERIRGRAASPVVALDRVSFQVGTGEIYGIVGPNGSGKTTLIKVCATLHLPDEGRGWIAGIPLERASDIRAHIGLLTDQERSFFWRLSGRANLSYFGRLFDLDGPQIRRRLDELSEILDLGGLLDRRYDRCSAGMKQRIALARSLLAKPRVLLLDEPTRSLDPVQAGSLVKLLKRVAGEEGVTIVASSHQLDYLNDCADRVGLLHDGRLVEMKSAPTHPPGEAAVGTDLQALYLQTLREVEGQAPADIASDPSPVSDRSEPAVAGQVGAGVSGQPPRRRPAWLKALDLLFVEAQMWLSYRFNLALGLIGLLFFLAALAIVSRMIGEGGHESLARYGADYFTFVVVGLAFAGLQGVALNSLAGTIRKHQQLGTLEFLMLSATPFDRILLASTILSFFGVLGTMSGYVLVGDVVFDADFSQLNLGASLVVFGFSVASILGFGLLSAGAVMVLKRADALLFYLHGLMLFFGGVLFPVELLPSGLQVISRLLPITYALSALRKTMIAGAGFPDVGTELAVLSIFAAVSIPLGLIAFRGCERKARLEGTLLEF